MGKNGLGQVFPVVGRPSLYFLSIEQSHFKHSKVILTNLAKFVLSQSRDLAALCYILLAHGGRRDSIVLSILKSEGSAG